MNESTSNATENAASEFPAILETLSTRLPTFRRPIYFGWRLAMRWGQDQCPLKAAAMAFFGLLSIFPLLLAAVSILATVLAGDRATLQGFEHFVTQFFPGQTGQDVALALQKSVNKIASGTSATTVSILAVASLIWSGRAYFATLVDVLSSVWPRSKPRDFWKNQVALWSTFAGAGALWLLSTIATLAIEILGRILEYLPSSFLQRLPILYLASRISSWLLTVFMFWLIYRFLPNVDGKRRRRIVWGAAVLAALLWELSKFAFAEFLGNLHRYQATYGGVAGVVVTLMWIYFSSMIILLGAEAAAAYEETVAQFSGTVSTPAAVEVVAENEITENEK